MKKVKPQPATHERPCKVCGQVYIYPERGSAATRFLCALCAELPPHTVEVCKRMARRITALERSVAKLVNQTAPPPKQETSS
jgi:hypothetical protein